MWRSSSPSYWAEASPSDVPLKPSSSAHVSFSAQQVPLLFHPGPLHSHSYPYPHWAPTSPIWRYQFLERLQFVACSHQPWRIVQILWVNLTAQEVNHLVFHSGPPWVEFQVDLLHWSWVVCSLCPCLYLFSFSSPHLKRPWASGLWSVSLAAWCQSLTVTTTCSTACLLSTGHGRVSNVTRILLSIIHSFTNLKQDLSKNYFFCSVLYATLSFI